jgi:hypothetical protein
MGLAPHAWLQKKNRTGISKRLEAAFFFKAQKTEGDWAELAKDEGL